MMDYEMPPMNNFRTYRAKNMLQSEAASFMNRTNGIWARENDDHVEYGLSPVISYQPSADEPLGDIPPGKFIPNPYGDTYLDMAEERIVAEDGVMPD